MNTNTPEMESLGLEELFGSVQSQLKELREELVIYKEEMRAGEELKETVVKDTFTRLKGLVQQCSGLEKILAECRKHQGGGAQGIEFNFDAARSEVGCALNRIRDCREARSVSE